MFKTRYYKFFLMAVMMLSSCQNLFSQQAIKVDDKYDVLSIDNKTLANQSVLNEGDLSRIIAVLAKAERGEDIVVGAIGGSITMGAAVSTPTEGRWANRVAQWFRNKYPNIKVQFYNGGIGATNSTFGALRAYTDLLQYKPDLVLFEFSINDSQNDQVEEGAEGLLRQILTSVKQPAVIMLAMMNQWGGNVQEKHLPLAQYYSIPFVSFRNVFEPMLKDSIISPKQLLADAVHPNTTGHELAGRIVNLVLDKAYASKNDLKSIATEIPAPLYSDKLEHIAFAKASDIKFTINKGWVLIPHEETKNEPWRLNGRRIIEKVWNATTTGSLVEFEYEGTFFSLTYFLYKAGTKMGIAKLTIDGKEYAMLKGNGEQTWGGLAKTIILGDDLPFGKHQVSMELLPAKGFQNAGNGFDIVAVAYGNK